MAKLHRDLGLEFPVLHDPDNHAAKAWGIFNEDSGKVPHPTAAVIDREGLVRYFRVDEDYKKRPKPEELLNSLKEIESASSLK